MMSHEISFKKLSLCIHNMSNLVNVEDQFYFVDKDGIYAVNKASKYFCLLKWKIPIRFEKKSIYAQRPIIHWKSPLLYIYIRRSLSKYGALIRVFNQASGEVIYYGAWDVQKANIPEIWPEHVQWICHKNKMFLYDTYKQDLWGLDEKSGICHLVSKKFVICDQHLNGFVSGNYCISSDGLFIYAISFDLARLDLYLRDGTKLVASHILSVPLPNCVDRACSRVR